MSCDVLPQDLQAKSIRLPVPAPVASHVSSINAPVPCRKQRRRRRRVMATGRAKPTEPCRRGATTRRAGREPLAAAGARASAFVASCGFLHAGSSVGLAHPPPPPPPFPTRPSLRHRFAVPRPPRRVVTGMGTDCLSPGHRRRARN